MRTLLFGLPLLLAGPADAQCSLGSPGPGFDVALSGTTLATGMPDFVPGGSVGRVDLRTFSGGQWTRTQTLTTDDPTIDVFGTAVAMDDDVLAVGAATADGGRVLIYERSLTGWSFAASLKHSDAPIGFIGGSVAVDGERVLAGAIGHAVYVFERVGGLWSETAKLVAGNPLAAESDDFGHALDLDGNIAVVGAPFAGLIDHGAAYVYERTDSGWFQRQLLLPGGALGPGTSLFGASVAVEGATLLVGSPGYHHSLNRGAIFAHQRVGPAYRLSQIIEPPLATPADLSFGGHLALDGDLAVASGIGPFVSVGPVAAPLHRVGGVWTLHRPLDVPKGPVGMVFQAGRVSLSGGLLAVVDFADEVVTFSLDPALCP